MEICTVCGKAISGPHEQRQVITDRGEFILIHNECYADWEDR
jgi:hypothetical protein